MSTYPGRGPGMPGMGPEEQTASRKFLTNTVHLIKRGAKIDADSVDDGNTDVHPTVDGGTGRETTLRSGLVVVQVIDGANAGKYVPKGHADCPDDGDIEAAGILMNYVNMLGADREPADQPGELLIHGFVRESEVLFGETADAGFIAAVKDVLPLIMWEADIPQP